MSLDPDLPEPRPTAYKSAEERRQHKWKLVFALFVAAVLYSTLHKLVVPLFLSRMQVFEAQYGQVDFWFVPAWSLLAWLWVRGRLGVVGSLNAGLLVAYGAWELVLVLSQYYVGWLSLSHLLSSVPVGLTALIMLSFPDSKRNLYSAWMGALVGAVIFASSGQRRPHSQNLPTSVSQAPAEAVAELQADACGQESFRFRAASVRALASLTSLDLSDCGFAPQALWSDSEVLQLKSHLGRTVNVHIVFFSNDFRPLRHVNKILKPQAEVSLDFGGLRSGEAAGLLFSDASFAKGAVVLLSRSMKKVEGHFVVRARRDLRFEREGAR